MAVKHTVRMVIGAAAIAAATSAARAEIPLGLQGLTLDGSLAVREAYDTNPRQAHGDADRAKDSWVTMVSPTVGATWKKPGGLDLTMRLEYTPSALFYHNLPDESFFSHAVNFWVRGKAGEHWTYDFTQSLLAIDGESEGVIYHEAQGAPALGGIAIRDRRDALVFRGNYKVQYTEDPIFVRPVANVYYHDWHIAQSAAAGYTNFTNRGDYNTGVDLGYKIFGAKAAEKEPARDLWFVTGYRFGYQYQARVLTSPLEYSNTYHRVLMGLEGKPLSWLKFNFLIGPDFRDFSDHTAAGFDGGHPRIYEEGSLTIIPTPDDEVAFTTKRWEIPASGGKNVYEDSAHVITYRHKFNEKLTGSLGFGVYGGEWERPTIRHDWWFVPRASLTYMLTKDLALEGAYFSEFGRSGDDLTGRDFNRHVFTMGLKYSF